MSHVPIFRWSNGNSSAFDGKAATPLCEYWTNIYGDTAVSRTPSALPCGYEFFGAERMVYGSDYPFGPEKGGAFIRDNLTATQALNIPANEMKKILCENAKELLKIG